MTRGPDTWPTTVASIAEVRERLDEHLRGALGSPCGLGLVLARASQQRPVGQPILSGRRRGVEEPLLGGRRVLRRDLLLGGVRPRGPVGFELLHEQLREVLRRGLADGRGRDKVGVLRSP